jgi:hypothetical protein
MAYIKTDSGLQAFNTRSAQIAARLRPAFILFDGTKTNEQILTITSRLGVTQQDIDYLVQQGFLSGPNAGEGIRVDLTSPTLPSPMSQPAAQPAAQQPNAPTPALAVSTEPTTQAPAAATRTPQERYRDAKPLATMITAGLGFKGFRLNLAVEGAKGYDELLALLPKIQATAGERACMALEWALKG